MKTLFPVAAQEKTDIDLTPMLDVVFIMLVFFVVTATFLKETGVAVDVPSAYRGLPDDIESINVTVESAGAFVVNGRPMSKGSLIPYLTALIAQNPKATFSVTLAEGSVVEDAVTAVDAGRTLGFDVIPIIDIAELNALSR